MTINDSLVDKAARTNAAPSSLTFPRLRLAERSPLLAARDAPATLLVNQAGVMARATQGKAREEGASKSEQESLCHTFV
jgi:hypothetical protein